MSVARQRHDGILRRPGILFILVDGHRQPSPDHSPALACRKCQEPHHRRVHDTRRRRREIPRPQALGFCEGPTILGPDVVILRPLASLEFGHVLSEEFFNRNLFVMDLDERADDLRLGICCRIKCRPKRRASQDKNGNARASEDDNRCRPGPEHEMAPQRADHRSSPST